MSGVRRPLMFITDRTAVRLDAAVAIDVGGVVSVDEDVVEPTAGHYGTGHVTDGPVVRRRRYDARLLQRHGRLFFNAQDDVDGVTQGQCGVGRPAAFQRAARRRGREVVGGEHVFRRVARLVTPAALSFDGARWLIVTVVAEVTMTVTVTAIVVVGRRMVVAPLQDVAVTRLTEQTGQDRVVFVTRRR